MGGRDFLVDEQAEDYYRIELVIFDAVAVKHVA